jgi:hypothetical protein
VTPRPSWTPTSQFPDRTYQANCVDYAALELEIDQMHNAYQGSFFLPLPTNGARTFQFFDDDQEVVVTATLTH